MDELIFYQCLVNIVTTIPSLCLFVLGILLKGCKSNKNYQISDKHILTVEMVILTEYQDNKYSMTVKVTAKDKYLMFLCLWFSSAIVYIHTDIYHKHYPTSERVGTLKCNLL